MITIKRITPEGALVFKDVRLKDSPTAFSSTYERESQFLVDEWESRAARWGGAGTDTIYLAFEGEICCGIVGSYIEQDNRARAQVVSMWVDPSYRGGGVGKSLIDSVIEWNRALGVRELALMVTCVNTGAIAFYERLGFTKTGVTCEYPNDPSIIEHEMALQLE